MPAGSVGAGAASPNRSGCVSGVLTPPVSRIDREPWEGAQRRNEKRRASPAFQSIPPPDGRVAPVRRVPQGLEAVGNGQAACGFSVVCAAGAGDAAGAAAGLAAGALAAFFAGAFFAAFFARAFAAFFAGAFF